MLISTRSRYGLKIMYNLALSYGDRPVFLREIARAYRISEKYLSKLVIPLRGARLITSYRGAHGGYALARDPALITVREIVEVLEGGIVTSSGPARGRRGEAVDTHPTETVWTTVNDAVGRALDAVTLASLVQSGKDAVLNYQI